MVAQKAVIRSWRVCVATALLVLATGSLARETITFRFEGEVTGIDGQLASASVMIGDQISGTYTFDPNVTTFGPPIQRWTDAVLDWSVRIGPATLNAAGGFIYRDVEDFPSYWQVSLTPPPGILLLDDEIREIILSWDLNARISPDNTPPAAPGFRTPGTLILRTIDARIYATLTRVAFNGADTDFPASPAVWRAKPTPEQVPGGIGSHDGGKLNASLWFDDAQGAATLGLTDRFSEASLPRLYCGQAGREGDLLWQADGRPSGAEKRWAITRDSLQPAPENCGVAISTIASLRGAAEQRLIYVEYERNGATHRGQLWPKTLMADSIHVASTIASEGQVVGSEADHGNSRLTAKLRFNEQTRVLDSIDYNLGGTRASDPLQSAALHCAPAGVEGPAVAELRTDRNGRWLKLTTAGITPVGGSEACGMEINTVASLVEAFLQGHLYFRLEDTVGRVWRGQVPLP